MEKRLAPDLKSILEDVKTRSPKDGAMIIRQISRGLRDRLLFSVNETEINKGHKSQICVRLDVLADLIEMHF